MSKKGKERKGKERKEFVDIVFNVHGSCNILAFYVIIAAQNAVDRHHSLSERPTALDMYKNTQKWNSILPSLSNNFA